MVCGKERQVNLSRALENSDGAEEAAGIESIGGIKLMLDGLHQGQGIAGSAPGVESGHACGAMEENEGAAHFFEFDPQCCERSMNIGRGALEAKPAQTSCVHQGFPMDTCGVCGAS